MQSIAQTLHVTHVIEGSVRKDGNEVRITAQLIRADNGTHVWTESYNRELKSVFAIQEEIATAIVSASDTDSYQDYLRAKALVRGRGALEPGGPLTEAAKLLEQVVARDPNYAPAWAMLGQTYVLTPIFTLALLNGSTDELRRMATESLQKAEAAAQQAIRLDPNNVDRYIALALARDYRGGFVQAEDLYKQALSLDPRNPDAFHHYSLMLGNLGRLKDALPLRLRLQAQEPFVPVYNFTTATALWENGRNDEAIAILKAVPPSVLPRIFLAQVYASVARYSEAADVLRQIPSSDISPQALAETIRLLRSAPARTASPRKTIGNGLLGVVYLYAAAPDRALDFFDGLVSAGVPALGNFSSIFWAPACAPVRKTEAFKAHVRKVGFVDYWKARGWPDLCHPTTGDNFECN